MIEGQATEAGVASLGRDDTDFLVTGESYHPAPGIPTSVISAWPLFAASQKLAAYRSAHAGALPPSIFDPV